MAEYIKRYPANKCSCGNSYDAGLATQIHLYWLGSPDPMEVKSDAQPPEV